MKLAESCPPAVRKLLEEIWGVSIAGYLMQPPDKITRESDAALRHLDRRLREEGFLPTPARFVEKSHG